MNTQKKKLTLNKETLRDLTAHNAGEVKAGAKGGNGKGKGQYPTKKCDPTITCAGICDTVNCGVTEYCW